MVEVESTYVGIIYKYTSPSGKIYIGQTARPSARKAEHLYNASNKCVTIFHKAIKKYGWENFQYEVIQTIRCASKEQLKIALGKAEQEMIQRYNCLAPFGYNQAVGGEGPLGYKHSEEAKRQMSISHTGILHTEEERQKIAKANTGKKHSEETKQKIALKRNIPIIQLSMEGQFIKEYPSAKIAAEELGITRSNITACCRNKPKKLSVGGYKWKYKTDNINKYECHI